MPFRCFLPARALPVLVAVAALVAPGVSAPRAAASPAGDFVAMANSARADNGLTRYRVAGDLADVARRQAASMARNRRLSHTSNLGGKVCCWRSVGENVGEGPDARSIHRAFMGSSSHRGNILSRRFTEIGVGTARSSDGTLYVSEIFREPKGSTPAPAAAPAPQRTTRASRSVPRAPLPTRTASAVPRRPPAAVPAALSAAELLQRRLAAVKVPARLDPLARSRYWLDAMRRVAAN